MKRILFNHGWRLALVITFCNLAIIRCASPPDKDITGMYAASWTTEFTEAKDTMRIEPSVIRGNIFYLITRRTCMIYQKKPQHKTVHWTGTFNNTGKTIVINKNGRILLFDPQRGEMRMGATIYKKL